MRIVSWNCHYGLKIEKYLEVLSHSPQILIIQECTKNDFDYIKNMWEFKNWYNDDQKNNKSEIGVAIFSNGYKIGFTEIFNRNFRYVIPYEISKDNVNKFTLFSVWINPIIDGSYHKHFYDAVKYYREQKMLDDHSIIIGDFNTFAKEGNGCLEALEGELSPLSNCAKDKRFTRTYYAAKYGYGTDDFCFASKDIADKIEVTIPDDKFDDKQNKSNPWRDLSDHCPIIVDLAL